MCTLLSSEPQNKNLPLADNPQDVNPLVLLGGLYKATC